MTLSIADDFRASVRAILERYSGTPFEAIAPIRVAHVKALDAYITEAEDRAASCTCQPVRGFEIDVSRETPAYLAMEQARIDRLLFGEA